MSDVLADTHALVWFIADRTRLSAPALAALGTAERTGRIVVATISFVELTYLTEKGKIDPRVLSELWKLVVDPVTPVDSHPLTVDVARVFDRIPRTVVPDMPDRIIAATALALGLPLVSTDQKIHALNVPNLTVVW